MPLTARSIVRDWLVGLCILALITWGPPGFLRRAGEALVPGLAGQRAQTEALRRDSIRAVQVADSERTERRDSVRAVVFVPPDPLRLDQRSDRNRRLMRIAFFVAIPLSLVLNTVRWWRRRKRMFD